MAERDQSKSIFKLDEFKKYQDPWNERVRILELRGSYYTGAVYRQTFNSWDKKLGLHMGATDKVKGGIKPLYLPLSGAVDIDVGLIPGGWQVDTDLVSDELIEMVRLLLAGSNWKTEGTLYVEYGAKYGLSGIKVADLREERRVDLSPVDPVKFMPIFSDDYANEPEMVIYVEDRGYGEDGYEYAEVTTPELIQTFRDGELWGYDGRDAEYENKLGEVPYVQVKHIENGSLYGESTFEKAIPMLDEVNATATHLGDIIKKHADPQWAVMAEPTDLTKSGDNVWFFPDGGGAKPLVAQIDISGVLEFIREIAGNVKDALPESAWGELQKKKQIATETLEVQLYPLVIKIKDRCRPNYDDGLERAFKMAGRAGLGMGLEGDWGALAEGRIQLDGDRPVLPVDPVTRLKIEAMEREAEMTEAYYSGDIKMDQEIEIEDDDLVDDVDQEGEDG